MAWTCSRGGLAAVLRGECDECVGAVASFDERCCAEWRPGDGGVVPHVPPTSQSNAPTAGGGVLGLDPSLQGPSLFAVAITVIVTVITIFIIIVVTGTSIVRHATSTSS